MLNYFEFLVALKFLRSKRKESFISVISMFSLLGIALGVATLIVVMSVMNGYHKEFLRNILGIQGHVSIVPKSKEFQHYNQFTNELEKIQNIEFAAPTIIEQGMFVVRDKAHGGMVRGIDPDRLFLKPMISEKLDMNILVQLLDNGNIIVGSALAEQLGVTKGDEIKIIIPSGSTTLLGTIPRSKTFKVIGTFDVGLYQYNSTTVFVNLHDAQRLFKYNESVSEIEVMVSDPERNLDQVKADIAKFSGGQVYMVDWKMAQAKWLSALAVERAVMFFILMLIILVAVFNIISSLIMLVKDKSKAIAILRTMGAYKSSIIRIFMIAGTAIGLIGSTSGVLLGVLVAKNLDNIKALVENLSGVTLFDPVVYFLTQLPSDLYMSDVVLIFGLSFTLSVIATIYPAYRASKLLPTEVLRYE